MKVLIIGSGGREHALAWKIKQSPRVTEVICAPGNGGTEAFCRNLAMNVTDISGLVDFAQKEGIGLTVVGPDDSLAAGIVDAFQAKGLRIFGPVAAAAKLESSKIFAKEFMRRHGIPTAESREFSDSGEAHLYCTKAKYPLVIKADGLALGKGVIIAEFPQDAAYAIFRTMDAAQFGDAGKRIVIEEFLEGPECSIHALIDGDSYTLFPDCRDHKRAFDNDQGPNTGGMGTISPTGSITPELKKQIETEILAPFLEGIRKDGIPFKGMLFPGLILTKDGPKVLEFNCRFGDPETQVLMMRLKSDLVDLLEATIEGTLSKQTPEWDDRAATCVILASGGYPGSYEKSKAITGTETVMDAVVFHAGTTIKNGTLVTNGGRVMGVTALGKDLPEARRNAYAAADKVHFENLHRRKDIGG
ncbi:MAG: phosphoribosylamine--glycine ligase [Chthoniobacterales bacterium]